MCLTFVNFACIVLVFGKLPENAPMNLFSLFGIAKKTKIKTVNQGMISSMQTTCPFKNENGLIRPPPRRAGAGVLTGVPYQYVGSGPRTGPGPE